MVLLEMDMSLAKLPSSAYAMVMGTAATSVLLGFAADSISRWPSNFFLILAICQFLLLTLSNMATGKVWLRKLHDEFSHPIKMNFLPTATIGLILTAIALLPVHRPTAAIVGWVGMLSNLTLTILIVNQWLSDAQFTLKHINPAWYIPVVGNVLVPIIAVPLGANVFAWFCFSTGLMFWVVLQTLIFNRLIFHHEALGPLWPTLFILIAPPAAGFSGYTSLTGGVDTLANLLYFYAAFLTLLLIFRIRLIFTEPFALPNWASTFPLAAFGIASAKMAHFSDITSLMWIAYAAMLFMPLLLVWLLWNTWQYVKAQEG